MPVAVSAGGDIDAAVAKAFAGSYPYEVWLEPGHYVRGAPIPLRDGLRLIGSQGEMGLRRTTIIENPDTDMFSLSSNVTECYLRGISFVGDWANKDVYPFGSAPPNGYFLQYSKIVGCSFEAFNLPKLRIGGTVVRDCNFANNANGAALFSGWDNYVGPRNFMDSSVTTANDPTDPMVTLDTTQATMFYKNFITAGLGYPLLIQNSLSQEQHLSVYDNHLDGRGNAHVAGAGVYILRAGNVLIRGNRFHNLLSAPFGNQRGIVSVDNGSDVLVALNAFHDCGTGSGSEAVLSTAGVVDNVIVANNLFKGKRPAKNYMSVGGTATNIVSTA